MEYALAGTCVFAKQSLGPILCGQLPLRGAKPLTVCRHPLSRSYGVILPSSFSVNHSSTLGFSPRLPVSVCGTVGTVPRLRSFSRQCAPHPLAGSENPFGIGSRLPGRICLPGTAYRLASDNPPPDGQLAPASLLRLTRHCTGTGILPRFPSATPFGLTLGTD